MSEFLAFYLELNDCSPRPALTVVTATLALLDVASQSTFGTVISALARSHCFSLSKFLTSGRRSFFVNPWDGYA
jgi:hypothetical protein